MMISHHGRRDHGHARAALRESARPRIVAAQPPPRHAQPPPAALEESRKDPYRGVGTLGADGRRACSRRAGVMALGAANIEWSVGASLPRGAGAPAAARRRRRSSLAACASASLLLESTHQEDSMPRV